MQPMKDFFRIVSRLRQNGKRGRIKDSLLYITPEYQLVCYSIGYGRRDVAIRKAAVNWEYIDLNCSQIDRPLYIGTVESLYQALRSIGGRTRKEKVKGAKLPYIFSAAFQNEADALKDQLEEGAISDGEYWEAFGKLNDDYKAREEGEEIVLPFCQSVFDVEIIDGQLVYCYNVDAFDELDLVSNPLETLARLSDNNPYGSLPGIDLPPIPSVSSYRSDELKTRLAKLQTKYSGGYILPSFFGFSARDNRELEKLSIDRKNRIAARHNRTVKTDVEKTLERERKEKEKAARQEASKSTKSTRGAVLMFSGKDSKIYHDLSDKMFLIFCDDPQHYRTKLTGIGFSFRQDLGGVFRYGAKSDKGREAVEKAKKILAR